MIKRLWLVLATIVYFPIQLPTLIPLAIIGIVLYFIRWFITGKENHLGLYCFPILYFYCTLTSAMTRYYDHGGTFKHAFKKEWEICLA